MLIYIFTLISIIKSTTHASDLAVHAHNRAGDIYLRSMQLEQSDPPSSRFKRQIDDDVIRYYVTQCGSGNVTSLPMAGEPFIEVSGKGRGTGQLLYGETSIEKVKNKTQLSI